MFSIHEPQLTNTIGHAAGAIIFGIFLFLMLRDRSATRMRGSWLSFAAAALAFLWNVGSLAVLFSSNLSPTGIELVVFASFAVLSFLPAVLLHISLDGSFMPVIAAGYLLGIVATFMHLLELFYPGPPYHQRALLLITVGFGVLTVIAVIAVLLQRQGQRKAKASRIFGAMCSALLATSFVHFGYNHPSEAWSRELVFHHAGIPLALFVLLQDYRFILLDAFIRFLANALLAVVVAIIAFRIVFHSMLIDEVLSNPIYATAVLISFCLLLIGFALIRGQLQQWLTKVVFRRTDVNKCLQEIYSRATWFQDEAEFLRWAANLLSRFMSTDRVEQHSDTQLADVLGEADVFLPVPASDIPGLRRSPEFAWAEAIVPLRFGHGDLTYFLLGRRRGGRRYLSEDLNSLNRLAAAIVEQIERIRKLEMHRLVSQAELRALQSQINPHFLFNALNTLYGIIPREASGARKTVLNLAEIFRYFLQSEKTFIQLSDELEIVKAYLDIERLRLGSRLEVQLDIDDAALNVPIPILSIQPLVENAIKHGISTKSGAGLLQLKATMFAKEVVVTVQDDGEGFDPEETGARPGIGLANVKRRLQLCYGTSARFTLNSGSEGTKVEVAIPLDNALHDLTPLGAQDRTVAK